MSTVIERDNCFNNHTDHGKKRIHLLENSSDAHKDCVGIDGEVIKLLRRQSDDLVDILSSVVGFNNAWSIWIIVRIGA